MRFKRVSRHFVRLLSTFFIAVGIIVAVACVTVNVYFSSMIMKKAEQAVNANLSMIKLIVEDEFISLYNISHIIGNDYNFIFSIPKNGYDAHKIAVTLRNYVNIDSNLYNMAVWDVSGGKIYDTLKRFDEAEYFDKYIIMDAFDFGELKPELLKLSKPAIFPIGNVSSVFDGNERVCLFAVPQPANITCPKIVAFFFIKECMFANAMQIPEAEDFTGSLILADYDGSYLMHYSTLAESLGIPSLDTSDKLTSQKTLFAKGSYCNYQIITDGSALIKEQANIRNIVLLLSAAMVLSGFIISIVYSVYNYLPVKKLSKKIIPNNRLTERSGDEYGDILNEFNRIRDENMEITQRLNKCDSLVYQSLIRAIICGNKIDETFEALLRENNICFPYANFGVLVLGCSRGLDTLPEHIIQRFIEPLSTDSFCCYKTELNEYNAAGIIINSGRNDLEPIILLINGIIQELGAGAKITAGLGGFYGLNQINKSFEEAITAFSGNPTFTGSIGFYLEYREGDRQQLSHVIAEQLISYFHQNYGDPELCLAKIAEHFHLSASYISRVFKMHSGCSVMSFLDKIRMEKFLELLINSDMTIKEMIHKTGYVDTNNFTKKFKKNFGYTPQEYRKLYCQRDKLLQ